ncbi:MAG: FAD-dependent oxidoreductase [Eubacterium sp.]|jgi:glycine/D-amino acid oxidase-like deaminating enzyme|nr:FAD-dependent oxidoreductase [Eubacterium sp.]
MSKSVWIDGTKLPKYQKLQGKVKTDVLVIGGGITGILCSYFLKQSGVNTILVEADRICHGVTGNTTAKLTSQHGLVYEKMIQSVGKEMAGRYLEANEQALERYRELAKNINCDFERKDSFIYSCSNRSKIEKEVEALTQLGIAAEFCEHISIPLSIRGAVKFPNQAQFNPLMFLSEIVKGLEIYEHTFIKDIAPHKAWSNEGEITANKIIVATHFPFLNKHGSYFLKLYQDRSYVIALNNVEDVHGMYMDEEKTGKSFRNYKDLLLIGGGSHRTGKAGGNWEELREFAKQYFPEAEEKYAWATQDCMSLDQIPYIGRYSKRTPDLYVASGYNKWGMTTSMVAAMLLCDLVMEKKNEWEEVFSPSRSILKPQLFINGVEATKNLLTPTMRRCPHLGCALKWNSTEQTWDCPCHGSRFEKDGKIINNPATGDAKLK